MNRKQKTPTRKTAQQILNRAIKALIDREVYAPQELFLISDDQAAFQFGMLTAFDSSDGIERIQVSAFLDCPQQLLVLIGAALSEFVLIEDGCPSHFSTDEQTILSGDEAKIAHAKYLLLPYLTEDEAEILDELTSNLGTATEREMPWGEDKDINQTVH